MKKFIYILSFTLLGLLVASIVHAGIELPILLFVFSDYESYGDTFLLRYWNLIHGMGGAILWVIGGAVGFYFGRHYWEVIYGRHNTTRLDSQHQ